MTIKYAVVVRNPAGLLVRVEGTYASLTDARKAQSDLLIPKGFLPNRTCNWSDIDVVNS